MGSSIHLPLLLFLHCLSSASIISHVCAASALASRSLFTSLPPTACPCTLIVAVPHSLSPQRRPHKQFDVLVTSRRHLFAPATALAPFNHTSHPTTRDALFSYHVLLIPYRALTRVYVTHSRNQRSAHHLRTHIVRQDTKCPVILGTPNPSPPSPTPTPSLPTLSPTQSPPVPNQPSFRRGSPAHEPRIVGGQLADSNLASYLAYIHIPAGESDRACSGTVVGRRLVVTAAHCGVGNSSVVFVGGKRGNPSDGIRYNVESVKTHESFAISTTRRFRYDIAIITLVADVPEDIRFMKVNNNVSVPVEKSVVRAAGYGILNHKNQFSNPKAQLYHVDVPIVPQRTCENAYGAEGVNINYDFQVCAGYFGLGGCDSCQGDSGGPLFQYDTQGVPVLVGVVSIGVECANAKFPGVYVRTSAHDDFFPREGIGRSQDAVAVFSDFVPVKVIGKETIILAATGGAVVLFAVLFLSFVAVSKWKRDAAQHMEAPPASSSPPSSGPVLYSNNARYGIEEESSVTHDEMSGSATIESHLQSQSQSNHDHWSVERGPDMANRVSVDHQSHGVPPAHVVGVGAHAFESFDPYEQQDERMQLEIPTDVLQFEGQRTWSGGHAQVIPPVSALDEFQGDVANT